MTSSDHSSPTRFTAVDGHRIAYEVLGTGRPAMVFVHGWSGDRSHWHRQVPAFEDHQLVLVDLPGHGESDRPAITYSMDFLATAVESVLDAAHVDKAILIGHSNGVPVIRQIWRHQPERVIALVGIDGALRNTITPEVARWMKQMAAAPNFAEANTRLVEQTPTGNLTAEDVTLIKRGAIATPAHVHLGGLAGFEDPTIWNDDPITVPLLALQADSPQWSADYEAYVHRIAPQVEYRVLTGSHFLHMEHADAVNDLIREFVQRVGSESGTNGSNQSSSRQRRVQAPDGSS